MPRKIDQEIVDFLLEHKKEIGYSLPIDENEVDRIFEWFADQEETLSNQYCEGVFKDRAYLDIIANGLDNFHIKDGTSLIDLEDLNSRLRE